MEQLQGQMQEKLEKLQALQKTQQKTLLARQKLDSQVNENKLVKRNFGLGRQQNASQRPT